jgi:hypothetical protein
MWNIYLSSTTVAFSVLLLTGLFHTWRHTFAPGQALSLNVIQLHVSVLISACYIVKIRNRHGGIYDKMHLRSSGVICPKTSAKLIFLVGIFVEIPTWRWCFQNMKLIILALNYVFVDIRKYNFSICKLWNPEWLSISRRSFDSMSSFRHIMFI